MAETYKFEAEINQLMSIIINAFYSNKDVFLRELISNASDALDKVKYRSLTEGQEILGQEQKFEIKIRADKDNNQLIIYDTGIGMTKDELVKNLGTVAKSGTKAFMQSLKDNKGDINMIGQFGVGFYSAFLVGDKVSVVSKSPDDKCYMWESDAGEQFTITECQDDELIRGTKIIVHIKEDSKEYLEDKKLESIINTHSNYISYPILLQKTKTRNVEQPIEDTDKDDGKEDIDEPKVEDDVDGNVDGNVDGEPKRESITETFTEYDQVNNNKPIWLLTPKDVTEEQHKEFYKIFSNDSQDYQFVVHTKVEGNYEFTCLLYIPKNKPFDMFQQEKNKGNNVKLYVRRVFITDDCTNKLIPEYLSFVKGVVDSNDLPLNVSREMLQHTKVFDVIKKHIVKKILDMLDDSATNSPLDYIKFYGQFQQHIKLGVIDDSKNRDRLIKLLRFYSTSNKDKLISLDNYLNAMKEDQKQIYYITGESIKSVEDSPYMENLKSKGYDVLFFTDPIDEYVAQHLKKFGDKDLVDISREGLDLNTNKEDKEKVDKEFEPLCKCIKEILGDNVEKVVTSTKLAKTPCIISTSQYGYSANMERILKAQALQDPSRLQYMRAGKVFEINPNSKLIQKLNEQFKEDGVSNAIRDLVHLFFESSLISSGFTLEKPSMFGKRIFNIAAMALSVEDEPEEEVDGGMPNLEELADGKQDIEEQGDTVIESAMENID